MPEWGIAIIAVVVGALLGFFLNLWRDIQQEKKKRRQEALEVHFNQEMSGLLAHVGSRNGLTVRQDKHNELEFGLNHGPFFTIDKEYYFKKGELHEAFKAHFPEIAEKWEELHKYAVKLRKDNQNGSLAQIELSVTSEELQRLSMTANNKLEDIQKYQIGTVFKYEKRCPICRKF